MLSRGPTRCPFAANCHVLRNPELMAACQPAEQCPAERAFFAAYIVDARQSFSFCRQWLSEQDFEQTIAELAIVCLQRQRLSALVAKEGFSRPKVHPVSKISYGVELSLAAGRYSTALDNRFNALMRRILEDPAASGAGAAVAPLADGDS